MEEMNNLVNFEEVLDTENNDMWDIFFPYMADKEEISPTIEVKKQNKILGNSRHMKFLTM